MNALLKQLDRIPKPAIPVIGVLLVALLGGIDRLTGYEISFSIFYLFPVAFVAWFEKRNHAIMISVLSAVTWVLADTAAGHTYSNPFIPGWNGLVRLGFFLMAAYSLSAVKQLLEAEKASARIDYLTGLSNSRAFREMAQLEIDRSARFGRPLTMAYMDIDNFKQVNDSFGHSQGDNLLQMVAKTIKDNTRSIDMVSRLGGDEFALLFPETNEVNAKAAIAKVRAELLKIARSNRWPVTFSIGAVACYEACTLDELIKEADNLMYEVKANGKDRVECRKYRAPASTA